MKPEIRIFRTMEELSRNATILFIDQAAKSIDERGRFLVALNGGGTPLRLFQLLSGGSREKVDWEKIHVFWGDERLVPTNHPENNYGQARDLLLRHVPIPEANVHPIRTEKQPEDAARDYSRVLKQFTEPNAELIRFDLILLGMGEDGHTASLFPGSPLYVREIVIPVTAEYQGRPAQRITLAPLVINNARMVVFMATGEKKADALREVLSGRYKPEEYPAQRIEPKNGNVVWLVDEDAASKLPHSLSCKFCEG